MNKKYKYNHSGMAGLDSFAYLTTNVSCEFCNTRSCCDFWRLAVSSHVSLSGETRVRGPYKSGEHIFHMGRSASSIYFVRHGAVKCERVTPTGGVHVAGFYLPGEMFGGEDIGTEHHCYDAIALDECIVCELPHAQLEVLFKGNPELHQNFVLRLSERIRRSERHLTESFHFRAKDRLIGFLCDIYSRLFARDCHDGGAILLPMHKVDIASFLGISPETLSRLLRQLENEGQIRNGSGQIELLDPEWMLGHCSQ